MKITGSIFLFIVVLSLIVSCGGGDGGGTDTSFTYSGSSSQAIITDTNAEILAVGAYRGGRIGMINATASSTATTGVMVMSQGIVSANSVQEEIITGDCGGTETIHKDINEAGTDFTGYIAFANYCSGQLTMSGNVEIKDGHMNSGEVTYILLGRPHNFSLRLDGGSAYEMQGDINFNFGPGNTTIVVMNPVLMRNMTNGKVFKLENYDVQMSPEGTYNSILIWGRYYDPDYGYVDVSTPDPFHTADNSKFYPNSGTLLVGGLNNTTASLELTSDTSGFVNAVTDTGTLYDQVYFKDF